MVSRQEEIVQHGFIKQRRCRRKLEQPNVLLPYFRGSWLGCFVSQGDKAPTDSTLPFLYCNHTAVSISRVAQQPAPQLPIGRRALEHVACRHRNHPSHPLCYCVISAGPGTDVCKFTENNAYNNLKKGEKAVAFSPFLQFVHILFKRMLHNKIVR